MKAETNAYAILASKYQHLQQNNTYSKRSENVLSEDKSLSLNDKEIDELIKITSQVVNDLLWQDIVLSRSELAGQTLAKDSTSRTLQSNTDTQSHPGDLEQVAEKIEVASSENEEDEGEVGDAACTWVLP
jgi:hypothetical protein